MFELLSFLFQCSNLIVSIVQSQYKQTVNTDDPQGSCGEPQRLRLNFILRKEPYEFLCVTLMTTVEPSHVPGNPMVLQKTFH